MLSIALQKRGGRQGSDIIGVTRIALNRIPAHDDAAAHELAEQQAVSPSFARHVVEHVVLTIVIVQYSYIPSAF